MQVIGWYNESEIKLERGAGGQKTMAKVVVVAVVAVILVIGVIIKKRK